MATDTLTIQPSSKDAGISEAVPTTNDGNGVAARLGTGDGNKYYRIVKITNLM